MIHADDAVGMKREFEVAAELFHQNATLPTAPEHERANFYRGLALLAEGLRKLEKRFDRLDADDGARGLSAAAGHFRRKLRARLIVAPHA